MSGARRSVLIILALSFFHLKTVWGNEDLDLVIIGAGVSGIAAACRLIENNFTNFLVLEGSDRIGGRVNSVSFGGSVIDLGAEWVVGKTNNPSFDLAAPLGLLYTNIDGGETFMKSNGETLFMKSNGEAVKQEFLNIFDDIYQLSFSRFNLNDTILPNVGNSKSVGDFVLNLFRKKVDPLIASGIVTRKEAENFLVLLEKIFNVMDGSASWFDTSLFGSYEFLDSQELYGIIWKGGFGYSTIIDLLLKKLPNPSEKLPVEEKILLNKEVVKVDWSGKKLNIKTADGSRFNSKRVLITVSAAVLKEKIPSMFSPSLPSSKMNALQGIGIEVIDKIYLEFPYHWLPSGVNGINMVWDADEKALVPPKYNWSTEVVGFYRSDRLPLTVLCGWIGGTAADAMEAATDEEVLEQSLILLKKFSPANTVIPKPISMRRTSWGSNRFIRGTYSFRHVLSDSLGVGPNDLAAPIANADGQQVLLFAGESTSDTNYGTVHGAIQSGWREADRVISLR